MFVGASPWISSSVEAVEPETVIAQAQAYADKGDYREAIGLLDTWLMVHDDHMAVNELRLKLRIARSEAEMRELLREESKRIGNPIGDPDYVALKARSVDSISQRLDLVEFLVKEQRHADAVIACKRILVDHQNDPATLALLDRLMEHVVQQETERRERERDIRNKRALSELIDKTTLDQEKPKIPREIIIFEEDLDELERQELEDLLQVRIQALQADEAPLRDVLRNIFAVAGLNYVLLDSAIGDETITFELLDESVANVLEMIQGMVTVQFNYRGGSVFVTGEDSPVLVTEIIRLKSGLTNVSAEPSVSTSISGSGGGGEGGDTGGGDAGVPDLFGEEGGGGEGEGETDLEKFLNAALTDGGLVTWPAGSTWFLDRKGTTLYVRSSPSTIAEVKRLVNAIDYNNDQVLIEARFVEVRDEAVKNLGVSWLIGGQDGDSRNAIGFGASSGSPINPTDLTTAVSALANPNGGVRLGVIGSGTSLLPNFSADLAALESRGDANVLSEPKIMALNNSWAVLSLVNTLSYIADFENRSVGSSNTNNDDNNDDDDLINNNQFFTNVLVPRFEEEELGIRLNVRPSLARNSDVVTLEIHPWVKELIRLNTAGSPGTNIGDGTSVLATEGIQNPEFSTRELSTRLHVKNGQTVVLGGLVSERTEDGTSGVPGLMGIPGFGRLFRNDSTSFERSKLLVFVTVHIVDPSGHKYSEQVKHVMELNEALLPTEVRAQKDLRDQQRATAAAEAQAKREERKRTVGVRAPKKVRLPNGQHHARYRYWLRFGACGALAA